MPLAVVQVRVASGGETVYLNVLQFFSPGGSRSVSLLNVRLLGSSTSSVHVSFELVSGRIQVIVACPALTPVTVTDSPFASLLPLRRAISFPLNLSIDQTRFL